MCVRDNTVALGVNRMERSNHHLMTQKVIYFFPSFSHQLKHIFTVV